MGPVLTIKFVCILKVDNSKFNLVEKLFNFGLLWQIDF